MKMNSIKKTARITGLLYLLMIPLGVFGILYVPSTLIVQGDVAATASNIVANETLFRISIVSALLVYLINIFVVLFLYKILKPVNKSLSALMVILLLVSVPIAFINELNSAAVLLLLDGAQQSLAQMSLFLDLHEYGIQIAGIFWGLWLLPMGYLVFKSNFIPKIIGVLLMIACLGYLADSFIFLIKPDFGVVFTEFTFIGEVAIALWLLIKGVDVKQWEKRSLESA